MKKGKIIIISGPSGSGKTTLYEKLLKSSRLKKKLVKIVSVTTRPRRFGEKNGRDYFFVSPKMFAYKKKAGHFLEAERVFCNDYGTPKKQVREALSSGKNVLLCIDVKGAKSVCINEPKAIRIFVNTPSFSVLKERLIARGSEKKKELSLRLKTAKQEMKEAAKYDYCIINDSLDSAFKRLERVISSII